MQTSKYHIERAESLLESAATSADAGGLERAAVLAAIAAAHAQTARALSARASSGENRGGGY